MTDLAQPSWCGNICPGRGQCPRFGIFMGDRWALLCRTREDYRKLWLEGRGPGQPIANGEHRTIVAADAERPPDQSQSQARSRTNGEVAASRHKRAKQLAHLRERCQNSIYSAIDLGKASVSEEEAEANLEVCLVKCSRFDGVCCADVRGFCAERHGLWIQRIVSGNCSHFAVSPQGQEVASTGALRRTPSGETASNPTAGDPIH